jgi:two-component system, chemotaxis family, response regulator Rcp1
MSLLNRSGRPIEILLVEDNDNDAENTMGALRTGRIRNRVHWVTDGEEALEFLRRKGSHSAAPLPDLILLDLNMPRKNGLEVLEEIKEHPLWKRIPVVMMTASEAEEDILSAYDRHANCYVTKPIDIDKFIEAVRSIEDFWLSIVCLPAA